LNPWGFVSVAALAVTSSLAAYVFVRGPRTASSFPFALLMGSFALWDASEAVVRLSTVSDLNQLLPWVRVQWIGIGLVSGTFLHFGVAFATARRLSDRRWQVPAVYAVSAVIIPLVVFTNLIVTGVVSTPLGPSADLGSGYLPAAVWYQAWLLITIAALLRAYARSGSRDFRRRTRAAVLILAVTATVGSFTELFWPFYGPIPTPLGLISVYSLAIAIVAAYSQVFLHFLEIQATTETVQVPSRHVLRPGLSYLFLSRNRDPAFTAFREMVGATPGICITGLHPSKVKERFHLERTPILWVTAALSEDFCYRPKALEFELLLTVSRFVEGNPSTVVLVDDLDLLSQTNGFAAVSRFLRRLNNLAANRACTTIAAVDPDALSEAQVALLRGLCDEVQEFPPSPLGNEPLTADVGAFLLEGDREAAYSVYESVASVERGLVVTTKSPVRVRKRLDVKTQILWVGGPGDVGEAFEGPAAIDLVAGKAAASLLRDRSRPIVYIQDMEQFLLLAPFPQVLEFIKGLIDRVAIQGGLVLASVAPKAVPPSELASLRRRFDGFRVLG